MGVFGAGDIPIAIVMGDFNSDGLMDLVTSGYSADTVLPQLTSVLSRTNVAFGKIQVGSSKSLRVTLTNTSGVSLSINRITLTEAVPHSYTQSNNCGATVPAGSSCAFTISFTPQGKRSYAGTLKISDSASSIPQEVYLRGTGAN
jgi:hypothetical protein